MDFVTFFILFILCVFGAIVLAMGGVVLVVLLPVIALVLAVWLLIFHTALGVLFILGCLLVGFLGKTAA